MSVSASLRDDLEDKNTGNGTDVDEKVDGMHKGAAKRKKLENYAGSNTIPSSSPKGTPTKGGQRATKGMGGMIQGEGKDGVGSDGSTQKKCQGKGSSSVKGRSKSRSRSRSKISSCQGKQEQEGVDEAGDNGEGGGDAGHQAAEEAPREDEGEAEATDEPAADENKHDSSAAKKTAAPKTPVRSRNSSRSMCKSSSRQSKQEKEKGGEAEEDGGDAGHEEAEENPRDGAREAVVGELETPDMNQHSSPMTKKVAAPKNRKGGATKGVKKGKAIDALSKPSGKTSASAAIDEAAQTSDAREDAGEVQAREVEEDDHTAGGGEFDEGGKTETEGGDPTSSKKVDAVIGVVVHKIGSYVFWDRMFDFSVC